MSDHDPVLVSLQLNVPIVDVEESSSSGGSLSILLFGLLAMIGIRCKK
jgi:hypothetical protein